VACDPTGNAMVGVAELDGHPVGFVTCYADDRSRIGEIGNNAVYPDVQGRGVGPRLYEYAFGRLRERGMRYVRVSTGGDPAHAPARRAYEKAGIGVQLPGVEYYRAL
jgi:ribosomal protein S18 acetylase RimI-like enzyme